VAISYKDVIAGNEVKQVSYMDVIASEAWQSLIYKKKENIGTLTINRPDKLNAISNELTAELHSLLSELEKDEELKALIITGAGDKAFVAGADIKELVDRDARIGRRVSRERQEVFSRIENLPVPVIAAVNGYALGGGLEIALACNIRLCSEKAQFGAPEVKLGIIPGDGGTQRLPRLVGLGRAMEMILTGDFIDAQEAYRIGLVNKVFPHEELMDKAMELAQKIASRPPLASQEGDKASGYALESYLHALTCTTEDKKEGVAAFLEKRKGKFKGK
jgi:enoyl-CoA hydratase